MRVINIIIIWNLEKSGDMTKVKIYTSANLQVGAIVATILINPELGSS